MLTGTSFPLTGLFVSLFSATKDDDPQLYQDIYEESMRLVRISDEIKISVLSNEPKSMKTESISCLFIVLIFSPHIFSLFPFKTINV